MKLQILLRENNEEFSQNSIQQPQSQSASDPVVMDESVGQATALIQQQHFPEAIATLKQGLVFRPDDSAARKLLITVYLQQGQTQEAEKLLQTGLNQQPRNPAFIALNCSYVDD